MFSYIILNIQFFENKKIKLNLNLILECIFICTVLFTTTYSVIYNYF